MPRLDENLKTLERLTEDVPAGERPRFFYNLVLELSRQIGVRRFYLAVKAARRKHGL